MKAKLIPGVVVMLVLLLTLSLFANVRLIIFSRASSTGLDYSVENSYLFASPLEARANGQEKIRITVFVINREGRGVANQQILLTKSPELVLEQINSLTDTYGRAVFDLSTTRAGVYMIGAALGGKSLGESLKIVFN
jgi:hypothetical protein